MLVKMPLIQLLLLPQLQEEKTQLSLLFLDEVEGVLVHSPIVYMLAFLDLHLVHETTP